MIKVKRICDPPSRGDGKRILVDRMWPRGVEKDEAKIEVWLKDIAPSGALRKWFGRDPEKWPAFREEYGKELEDKTEMVNALRKEAKTGTVTLLFSAKDSEHNNAVALKWFIERMG